MHTAVGKFTEGAKRAYLETLAKAGTVQAACHAANVTRECIRVHRGKDPEFVKAEELAKQQYRELVIEAEIKRRAIDGVDRPIYYLGKQIAVVKEYSDKLLIVHARRHIPEYRDSAPARLTINDNRQVNIIAFSDKLAALFTDRRNALREIGVIEDHAEGSDIETRPGGGNGKGNGSGADE